jgi:hypothetical protein
MVVTQGSFPTPFETASRAVQAEVAYLAIDLLKGTVSERYLGDRSLHKAQRPPVTILQLDGISRDYSAGALLARAADIVLQ